MTQTGMILGTAAYMAPEQARGRAVDKRADIWAFGVVLYEMLTGTRAFQGEDVSVTLAAVLTREPDFAALPATVPARVPQALRVACARTRSSASATSATCASRSRARSRRPRRDDGRGGRHRRGRTVGMGRSLRSRRSAGRAGGARAAPSARTAPPAPHETRMEIVTPTTDLPTPFALSPDGRQIVFVASGDGASRLWLRSLATTTAQPLAGTEGAILPFWSPDGRSVGFFAGTS